VKVSKDWEEMTVIETDGASRVVLIGHPSQLFLAKENEDGSILLQPARVATNAQLEYNDDPELRELLSRNAGSKTVQRLQRKN
jgi:hypothetical protein